MFAKMCDFDFGLAFEEGKSTSRVGYLYSLTLNGNEMSEKITIGSLPDGSSNKEVAGILSSLSWEGRPNNPIVLEMGVSTAAKSKLREIYVSKVTKIDVKFQFYVFEYEETKDHTGYYSSIWVESAIEGRIAKDGGGNLNWYIGEDPMYGEDGGNKYYPFNITLAPPASKQDIQTATSNSAKQTLAWGITGT